MYRADWVPAGFTELEYLESSGTQYILVPEQWTTDYTTTESSGVKLKGYFTYGTAVNAFVAGALWGVTVKVNSNGYIHNSPHHISGSTPCVSVGYYGSTSYTKEVANPWMAELNFQNSDWRIIESGNGDVFSVDAHVKSGKRITIDECNYQGLFCLSEAVNEGRISNKAKGVLYWARFSQGAEITRDLVPVLDADGIPCMYDKVSKQCFRNSGTGTFGYRIKTADNNVAPLSLRDPYYVAPSGIYAKLIAENELEIVADTEEVQGDDWVHFANTGEAYEHFGITFEDEILV